MMPVLSDEDVAWIRENYIPYSRTHGTSALAKLFKVNQRTIWDALHGITHNYVGASPTTYHRKSK